MSEHIDLQKVGSVGRALDALDKVLTYLSMFTLMIVMLLTAADAFGRYFLNASLDGAMEFTGEYLLVAVVFFAIAYAYSEGVFVRVTFLVSKVPSGWMRLTMDYIVQAFCTLVCIQLLYAGFLQLQRVYDAHTITTSPYAYQLWPAYVITALGLALMTLRVTADLLQVRRGQSALFKRENEEIEDAIKDGSLAETEGAE